MADKFCIHCGSPLIGAKRFCSSCGRPAGGEPGVKAASPLLDGRISERLAAKVRMPGAAELLARPAPFPWHELRLSPLRAASPAPQSPRTSATSDSQ